MLYKLAITLILSFLILGCGKDKKVEDTVRKSINLDNLFVYDKSSPYNKVLLDCVKADEEKESCSLTKLPLIGQVSKKPTKNHIKQRLVVSHKWMGDRFLQMLDLLDKDILKLLASTTAIVIDDDVKPSFYWNMTGAIYLDPRYFWLTPKEIKDITKKEDFRNDYGKDLKFINLWRYIKNDKYAYIYYSLDSNVTRTKSDLLYPLARLLYHELAHANDDVPFNKINKLDKNVPIYKAIYNIRADSLSTKLKQNMPLSSKVLQSIGQVLYHGEKPTAEEKNLTASKVGELFSEDSAESLYSYSTQYEDLAMLFEATMMRYHYNLKIDLAFIEKPKKENNLTCSDYIVAWGVRDRLSEDSVKVRAKYVVNNILPSNNWDSFFDNNLTEPILMDEGLNWCESINMGSNSKLLKETNDMKLNPNDLRIPEL